MIRSRKRRKVTSPEPYGVKDETVKRLGGEYQIRKVPGDDRSKEDFTWQIRKIVF